MTAALLPLTPQVERRVLGSPLIVMLDVDGTLAPIAPRPEEALVPPSTRRAVAALAAREGVQVALVSGRAAADARRMVAVANVWVVGNHGCEVVSPEGESIVDPQVAPYRGALAQAARAIAERVRPVPGVIVEDKVWTLSVHYRLAEPSLIPRLRSSVSEVVVRHGLRMTEGKAVLEVRPPASVHKGTAVLALANRLGGLEPDASLVFAGDDRTDEDAFRALRGKNPRAVTIRVAEEEVDTAAEFTVAGPDAMRAFLEWLAAVRR